MIKYGNFTATSMNSAMECRQRFLCIQNELIGVDIYPFTGGYRQKIYLVDTETIDVDHGLLPRVILKGLIHGDSNPIIPANQAAEVETRGIPPRKIGVMWRPKIETGPNGFLQVIGYTFQSYL